MARQKVKLHEPYFPFVYIKTGMPIGPVGLYHRSI